MLPNPYVHSQCVSTAVVVGSVGVEYWEYCSVALFLDLSTDILFIIYSTSNGSEGFFICRQFVENIKVLFFQTFLEEIFFAMKLFGESIARQRSNKKQIRYDFKIIYINKWMNKHMGFKKRWNDVDGIPDHSGREINSNNGQLYTPQSSRIGRSPRNTV